jgi:hypothetical protein
MKLFFRSFFSRLALGGWLFAWVGLAACGLRNETVPPEEEFNKIYNNTSFDNISALDIKPTADGGYIILGYIVRESGNGQRIPFLLKVGPTGATEWDTNAQAEFGNLANPTGRLKVSGDDFVFLCTQREEWVLVRVNAARRRPEVIRRFTGGEARVFDAQPTTDGGLLLLGSLGNCGSLPGNATQLVKTDQAFGPVLSRCYAGIPVNPSVFNQVPDQFAYVGETTLGGGRLFYFQAWYRNEWALNFVNAASGEVVQTYRYTDPVSQSQTLPNGLLPLGENRFAAAFTNGNTVFLNAGINLLSPNPTNDTPFSAPGDPFHELKPDKRVLISPMRIAGNDVVAMAAAARNNQIALFIFQPGTRNLRGRLYLGSTNPYIPNGLIQTSDGGLAIVGTTTVAGRFARIVLIKISEQDIQAINNQCQSLGLCQ